MEDKKQLPGSQLTSLADLDYFTVDEKNPIPENDIRKLMNIDSGIMKWILPRLEGMTIAGK